MRMNKNSSFVLLLILLCMCCSEANAKIVGKFNPFFADKETDHVSEMKTEYIARSVITKAYTLDLLYKNPETKEIYNSVKVYYLRKNIAKIIDPKCNNKYGLIIDVNKVKDLKLDIYNDDEYLSYLRAVNRNEVLKYIASLRKQNKEFIPIFINEAALYFNNPEFYIGYAQYLTAKSKKKITQEIADYYLLGGDYQSVVTMFENSRFYSQSQRAFIYSKAGLYNKAFELILSNSGFNNEGLSKICEMVIIESDLTEEQKEAILLNLPLEASNKLVEYYVEITQPMKGYLFARYRFKSNGDLLTSLKSKELNLRNDVNAITTEDVLPLYMLAGWYKETYDLHIKSRNYLKAVEIVDQYPGLSFSDSLSTFSNAAAQVISINSKDKNSITHAADLYARAQDWNKAGFCSEQAGNYNQAIEYYEKGTPKNIVELSRLYEIAGNYKQAADYLVLADPTDYEQIAKLYEKGKEYKKAATYYLIARNYTKCITCAEAIYPKDYGMLVDAYFAKGNSVEVVNNLKELYRENPEIASKYFIKTNHKDLYRSISIEAGKFQDALNTYLPDAEYSDSEIDELITLSINAGDKQKEILFSNIMLDRCADNVDNLDIPELSAAIALAQKIGNQSKVQVFASAKKKLLADQAAEQARLAKEEREEKARLAKEEKEEKARIAAEEREERNNRTGNYTAYTRNYGSVITIDKNEWFQFLIDSKGNISAANDGRMVGNDLYDKDGEYIGYYKNSRIHIKSGMVFSRE
ncbi:MAG: hypothetical protein PHO32_01635 [Candidatus Cloacimonetes bacterium]|nr:hypothetical protein [Candidatus Cloacimonadota bacterium]